MCIRDSGKRAKKRSPKAKRGIDAVPFDPATAMLERFVGASTTKALSKKERGPS